MIKLVVFDWNGVLIADTEASLDADNHILEVFGGTPVDLKTYRETVIIPSLSFYVMHGVDKQKLVKNTGKWAKIFHEFYEARVAKCRSRQNARKLLKWLKGQSIKSIVLSNHTVKGIGFQLKRLGIKDYISEVLANPAEETSLYDRNKQEKLEDYVKRNGYEKGEILIIGDSPEEIEMGKALGIANVAITQGYYSTSRLKASNPDFLIANLGELIGIVQGLNE